MANKKPPLQLQQPEEIPVKVPSVNVTVSRPFGEETQEPQPQVIQTISNGTVRTDN